MSNFTTEIKHDILNEFPHDAGAGRAAFSALLLTSGSVTEAGAEFISESEGTAEYFLQLADSFYGARFEIKGASLDYKRERDKLTFFYNGERFREIAKDYNEYRELTGGEEVRLAFLRCAFLGGGSCTLPSDGTKTGYHLEFLLPHADAAEHLLNLLAEFEILARSIGRGEKSVVYLKSGEAISDFLSVIGADGALKILEEMLFTRARSNNENRVSNCFAGNLDRSARASVRQILFLKTLDPEKLPPPLKEAALARIKYPTATLKELAEMLGISKSCLNHRLRRLTSYSGDTEETHD